MKTYFTRNKISRELGKLDDFKEIVVVSRYCKKINGIIDGSLNEHVKVLLQNSMRKLVEIDDIMKTIIFRAFH